MTCGAPRACHPPGHAHRSTTRVVLGSLKKPNSSSSCSNCAQEGRDAGGPFDQRHVCVCVRACVRVCARALTLNADRARKPNALALR